VTLARFLRSPAIVGVYRPRHPERPALYRVLAALFRLTTKNGTAEFSGTCK
jgi:hypothetical protein